MPFYLDVLGYFPRKISFSYPQKTSRGSMTPWLEETPVQSAFLGSPKAKIDFELYYNETGTLWGFFCMRLCSVSVRMESLPGHTLYASCDLLLRGVPTSHLSRAPSWCTASNLYFPTVKMRDRLPVQDRGTVGNVWAGFTSISTTS